jgi:2-polyprenyl-3-methyl-5-hydroxy-6-metoxy-1,4-benzoquinol methylase
MESKYSSHVDAANTSSAHGIALRLVGQEKTVLELGAASGHVTKALKAMGNSVTAVERDGRFAEQLAACADTVIITDLDWLDLREQLAFKKFDVVLAGDVLEHCSRPDLVIRQLHDLLQPEGYIVISLPNIAHGDMRLSLLAGNFDYRETGLLDRTHLRFFTRKSIDLFLSTNDFKIDQIFTVTVDLGLTELGRFHSDIPIQAIDYVQQDPDATVYQYVVKAFPEMIRTFSSDTHKGTRFTSTRIDQLLAENSRYQEIIAETQSVHEHDIMHKYRCDEEIESLREKLHSSYHKFQITNSLLLEEQQRVVELIGKMEQLENGLSDSRIAYLAARDSAIGAAAEVGELRFLLARAQHENTVLVHQINLLHTSRTWKIGRTILLPLRILRKVLRMLMS